MRTQLASKPRTLANLANLAKQAAETARLWTVIPPEGDRLTVSVNPPATLAEIRARYPGSDVRPVPEHPAPIPLIGPDRKIAERYLDHIGETDQDIRREFLEGLARDRLMLELLFDQVVEAGLYVWVETT